ncbi:hypothetical protein D3C81_343410 [compost metagenome]
MDSVQRRISDNNFKRILGILRKYHAPACSYKNPNNFGNHVHQRGRRSASSHLLGCTPWSGRPRCWYRQFFIVLMKTNLNLWEIIIAQLHAKKSIPEFPLNLVEIHRTPAKAPPSAMPRRHRQLSTKADQRKVRVIGWIVEQRISPSILHEIDLIAETCKFLFRIFLATGG